MSRLPIFFHGMVHLCFVWMQRYGIVGQAEVVAFVPFARSVIGRVVGKRCRRTLLNRSIGHARSKHPSRSSVDRSHGGGSTSGRADRAPQAERRRPTGGRQQQVIQLVLLLLACFCAKAAELRASSEGGDRSKGLGGIGADRRPALCIRF